MTKYLSIFLLHFGLFINVVIAQEIFKIDTLHKAAYQARGINIVFMADGFKADEQGDFMEQASRLVRGLMDEKPFSLYSNSFNVYALRVVSTSAEARYFESIPYPADSKDLLRVNSETADKVAKLHGFGPNTLIIMLINSEGGYANTLYSKVRIRKNARVKTLVHEVGHAFGKLADEYWTNIKEKPNKTPSSATLQNVSWKNWIGSSDNNDGKIGLYPYGDNEPQSNWFRPSQACLMRYTKQQSVFCPVCLQAIIEKIQELVIPVGGYTSAIVKDKNIISFKVTDIIKPKSNTLKINWILDGKVIASDIDSVDIDMASFKKDSQLVVRVIDSTNLIRVDKHEQLHFQTHTWTSKDL